MVTSITTRILVSMTMTTMTTMRRRRAWRKAVATMRNGDWHGFASAVRTVVVEREGAQFHTHTLPMLALVAADLVQQREGLGWLLVVQAVL